MNITESISYHISKIMEQHNPPHPGKVLMEICIAPFYKNVRGFSKASKIPKQTLYEITGGKQNIGIITAHKLALFLGMDAKTWLVLQLNYDISIYRQKIQKDST